MARPRIRPFDEKLVREQRIRDGMRRGYTPAFSALTADERVTLVNGMIGGGSGDAAIQAATGLTVESIHRQRRRIDKTSTGPLKREKGRLPSASELTVKPDSGAYMRNVFLHSLPPPPSWRFSPDLRRLPPMPAHQSGASSSAGWCADEGEHLHA